MIFPSVDWPEAGIMLNWFYILFNVLDSSFFLYVGTLIRFKNREAFRIFPF